MRILELAVQGARGCARGGRLRPGPGLTAVTGVDGPLAALAGWALYDTRPGPAQDLLAPGARSGRVGLTLRDAAGAAWRLYRDLGSGAARLQRWDVASKRFQDVTDQATAATALLRTEGGLPPEGVWRRLYALGEPSPAKASTGGGMASTSPEGLRARLTQLEAARDQARQAEDLQFELDDVERALFEGAQGQGRAQALEDEAEALASSLEDARRWPPADTDLDALVEAEARAARRRDLALAQLRDRREVVEADQGALAPLWRDPWVTGGAAASAALVVLGLAFPGLRGLAAVVPGTAAAAVYGLWQWTAAGRRREVALEAQDGLGVRAEQVEADHARAARPLQELLEAAGVPDVEALRERIAEGEQRRKALTRLRKEAAEARTRWEAQGKGALDGLEARKIELEARLRGLSTGGALPSRALEQEIAEVRARLDPAGQPWGEPLGGEPEPEPKAPTLDPRADLEALATLGGGAAPAVVEAVLAGANAFLAAVAPRGAPRLVRNGLGLEVSTAGAPPRRLDALPATGRAVAAAAWRLGLLQVALRLRPAPVVVEPVAGWLPASAAPAWAEALRALGDQGQVLHLVADPSWTGTGDPVTRLEVA